MKRRNFLTSGIASLAATATATSIVNAQGQVVSSELPKIGGAPLFPISLAEWSLRGEIGSKKITNLDFPLYTKKTYGISAVEYVNGFFKDKAKDKKYLSDLKQRTAMEGITNVLIMVDGEGPLAAAQEADRLKAVDRHKQWVEAAQFIGCHTIRVNLRGAGSREEQSKQAIDGLQKLSTFAADFGINVVVENHGGHSSDGQWLANVLKSVNLPNCGSLPDFGNFYEYDRYQGIKDMMPYAKGVSAKCVKFDEKGNVLETDFRKAMKIVLDAGYRGWVGIEWGGGSNTTSHKGITWAKALLEQIRDDYSAGKL